MADVAESKPRDKPVLYCMYRGPGPAYRLKTGIGTRDHCLTKAQAPAYTMGKKYRDEPVIGPGPTYYYDPSLTAHGRSHAPSYVLSSRPKSKSALKAASELTPGPGDYDAHGVKDGVLSKEHKTPSISIGQLTKNPFKNEAPPPNLYTIKTGIGSEARTEKFTPSWSIGGRTDFGGSHYHGTKEAVPGPASYSATDPRCYKRTAGGNYTIQGRTKVKDYTTLKDNPGPNAYDQTMTEGAKKGFSLGVRHSDHLTPLISDVDLI